MKVMKGKGGLVVVSLGPGEMLLESIKKAAARAGVRDGAVVSGIGTLKNFRMHYITRSFLPPKARVVNVKKPLELASLSGVIANGEPHLHAVVSWGARNVRAGHVEDGCEVAYLAEVAILKDNSLAMKRSIDKKTGLRLLGKRGRGKR